MSYLTDRRWSNRFLDEIRQLIGAFLLRPAEYDADTQQATDLIVLKAQPWTVACRMRSHRYYARYAGEFTIRYHRPNGVKTELEKILAGFADLFFYGFADETDQHVICYSIFDLGIFREWYGQVQPQIRENKGETSLAAFRIQDFPRGFVRFHSPINSGQGQLALFAKVERP